MKKNIKEIIIGILQLLLFYVLPLFAGPTDAMGMVFLIIVGTFILSLLIGILSNNKIKYFYSVFTSIIFMQLLKTGALSEGILRIKFAIFISTMFI